MKAVTNESLYKLAPWLLLPIFLLGVLSIIATGGGGDDGAVIGKVTVSGTVTGSGGIGDVNVSAGGIATKTDANGFYELSAIPVPSNGLLVLTYEKDGYATYQRAIPVQDGERYPIAAKLMVYHYSEAKDAAVLQDIDILDPLNPDPTNPLAEMSFPAGSITSSGTVTINIGVGDPTTTEGAAVFPGDYMAASIAGGETDTPLESVAFTEITVTDALGNEIRQLSEPATLTVRLPDSLQTKYAAGDFIEWWSYDETHASWLREDADPSTPDVVDDAAVIDLRADGVLYAQAKVTHFTWWNVDEPVDQHACLCTSIIDADGNPMMGEMLTAEGVTYNGVSRPAGTNNDGYACVTIKRSSDTVTERIKLYAEFGGIRFHYNVTDSTEGDVDLDEIFTPTVPGSTVTTIPNGQCFDLANTISVGLNGVINGTVTREGSGSAVPDFTIDTNYGERATTNAAGQYSLAAPIGIQVSVFAVGLVSQTTIVQDANTPATVNFVVSNRDPVIQSITRVPEGSVNNSQSVNLTVNATDPDGDALSYTWSNDVGSLNQTSGASIIWTAPASGSGTATVTVNVSDSNGGQVSANVAIVYQPGSVGGTLFNLIIKDNLIDDQALSGVTVALYNTDNRSIERTLVSGANGLVDFGDVARERVTFTIAYENDIGAGFTLRYIDSFVEVLAAEGIVYYALEGSLDFNSPGSINITLSNAPIGAGMTTIEPTTAWWSHAANTGQLTNIAVYNYELQSDGKLSLLALTHDSSNSLIKWGMLEDQTFTAGASYAINLNQDPVVTGWSTLPSTVLNWFGILGQRKGVPYELYSTPFNFTPSASSSTPFPTLFPVDNYWVWAEAYVTSAMTLSTSKAYTTLPQTIEIPMADYNFDLVDYNTTTKTLSWTLAGSSARDVLGVNLTGISGMEQPIEWTITMSPTRSSWQMMDLPSPANTWINTADLASSIFDASVEVIDLDFLSGLDDAWGFFITGGDIEAASAQILIGEYTFIGGGGVLTAAKSAAVSKTAQQQAEKRSINDRLSGSLSGFRRR